VDAAYCISLVEQPERTARAAAHFHDIGLCRETRFYRAQRARNTDRGVWDSHRRVAQEAIARRQRRVLIMEDDVAFGLSMSELAPRISRALAGLPPDWWGLYLGHFPFQSYFIASGLLRTRSALTHAYIANTALLEWLAKTEPLSAEVPMWDRIGQSIDSAMSNLRAMYAVFPMVAMQVYLGDSRVDARMDKALAILLSPLHRLTMARNLRQVEGGLSRDAQTIRAAKLFDDRFYAHTYRDVVDAGVDPLFHYLQHGASEQRWPNPSFDPRQYASQATTLKRGENPLLHYVAAGGVGDVDDRYGR